MVTDTIGDFLTRIKNAQMAKHEEVTCIFSKLVESICTILLKEGFIENYEVIDNGKFKQLKVYLKFVDGVPAIREIKRVSKPGVRIYCGYKQIKPVMNGLGVGIYSTSKGVLTDKEAIVHKVGGEYLCYVY
ncbi:MAG: 30S ribosomal protein S8 [Candidatus Dojkabacteria bacterium]|nr:30S ribosomal protein S8 [Candidatus Dojkabacteria bacterium]